MIDIVNARFVVVVLQMEGCPACEEYVPIFKKVAARYAQHIPTMILDAGHPSTADLSEQYKVKYTPTTLLLRKPTGHKSWDRALSAKEIDVEVFQFAMAHLRAEE